jgi:hypothetical protein
MDLLALAGLSGDTDEDPEDEEPAEEPENESNPEWAVSEAQTEEIDRNDSEADSDYPEIVPGLKGVRLDGQITTLKARGDLDNYEE